MKHALENKRALVTGGSRGIGAGIVKHLASEGARVALTYSSSPEQAEEIAKAAQAFGAKSLAIRADCADANAAVERAAAELGGIDISRQQRGNVGDGRS